MPAWPVGVFPGPEPNPDVPIWSPVPEWSTATWKKSRGRRNRERQARQKKKEQKREKREKKDQSSFERVKHEVNLSRSFTIT